MSSITMALIPPRSRSFSVVALRTCSLAALVLGAAFGTGCAETQPDDRAGSADPTVVGERAAASVDATTRPARYARQWMTLMFNGIKGDKSAPGVAARSYAYAAIAMHEATVHGTPGGHSLSGQLNGLGTLPEPVVGATYDWETVLAQTMHRVVNETWVYPLRTFFEYTTTTQSALLALGPQQIGFRRTSGVPEPVIQASIAYANQLADALVPWIQADGTPQLRFTGWAPPTGPGKWVPTGFSDTDKVALPETPWMRNVRPLVTVDSSECEAPPPIPYDTAPSSAFYAQANNVYQTNLTLTKEQRAIAEYWVDGIGASGTPPGHWIAITTQFSRNGNLADAIKAYTLVSTAMFDAAISTWDTKYTYNVLRPETYIRANISSTWRTHIPTPQHPSYTSGHSGFSSSAAEMLTDLYGAGPFTDNTKGRRGFEARSFPSFLAAADEAGISRIYGGIHYAMDNDSGKLIGGCVAQKIRARILL